MAINEFIKKLNDYQSGKIPNTTYSTKNISNDLDDIRKRRRADFDKSSLYVKTVKDSNDVVTVPTKEQYYQRLNDVNNITTVPTKEQYKQYKSDSKVIQEIKQQQKYGALTTYDELIKAAKKTDSYQEQEWLKERADEVATSADLQSEYDALSKEYEQLFNNGTDIEKDIRRDEIEKELETLSAQIRTKEMEEDKQKNYTDIIENDPDAYDIVKKYASVKSLEPSLISLGHDYRDEVYTEEEQQKIYDDFETLKAKGYDTESILKWYERERESTENKEQIERWQNLANQNAGTAAFTSAVSVPMNTVGAISDAANYIGAEFDKMSGGDGYIDPNGTNVAQAQAIRQEVSDMLGKNIDNETAAGLAQFLYNTGMSMADFGSTAVLSAIPGGQTVGLAMLSTSAGVSAANDVINSGGDIDHAVQTGIAAGIFEALFEKISLDQLKVFKQTGNVKSVKNIILNILKGSVTEGSEEVFTDLANSVADKVINGDMSQFSQACNNYIALGYDEDEAWKMAAADYAKQLALDFAGGALSGGVLGGAVSTINYAGYKGAQNKLATELGKEIMAKDDFNLSQLVEQAKNSENKKAQKLAKSIEKSISENKGTSKISPADVGNLTKLLLSDTSVKAMNDSSAKQEEKLNGTSINTEKTNTSQAVKKSASANTINVTVPVDEEIKIKSKGFGENHPNGIIVHTNNNNTLKAVKIESSAKEYGNSDNTVVLKTNDGKLINADEVTASIPHFNQLLNAAKNFDTYGAQYMVSAYERYKEKQGTNADVKTYLDNFSQLYELGKAGASYSSIEQNGKYQNAINDLSADIAKWAVRVGYKDGSEILRNDNNKIQKIKMPGEKTGSTSKVSVVEGAEQYVNVTDEQKQVLQAIAVKTNREILLTSPEQFEDNQNAKFANGKVYIRADLNGNYSVSVALHEVTHGIRERAPLQYKALRDFVINYLVAKGENIDNLVDDIKMRWGKDASTREDQIEELVCQTVMAIATDEAALKKAISVPENKKLIKKVAEALKKIAQDIYNFMKGLGEYSDGHNLQAQPWLDDVQAIRKLAEYFSVAADVSSNTEQKNNTHKGAEMTKYSIDKNFVNVYDNWDKRTERFAFRVGTTSKVLQQLGIDNKKIWWDSTKIKKIKLKHPAMTDDVIKQVPNILENPILVMSSKTVPGRIVIIGDVYDANNAPVLAALELNPTGQDGSSLNIIKIASAYGKDVNLQGLINKSDILYIEPNKKRTHNWLTVNRLRLPLPSTSYGFIKTIKPQNGSKVNNNYIQNNKNNSINTEQKNNTHKGAEMPKYSIKDDYSTQVDNVINNTFDKNNHVYMGTTPNRLIKILDVPELPMLVTNAHIYAMTVSKNRAIKDNRYNKNVNYHNLGNKLIKDLPKLINNPRMIIKSNTSNNDKSFVVVLPAIDTNGNAVIAAIKPDGKGYYYNVELESNQLLSAYGKNNLLSYINTAYNEGRILYVNKENSQQKKNIPGVQFPNNILNADYSNNLSQFKRVVNNVESFIDDTIDKKTKYSMGGSLAETANTQRLDKAIELENQGVLPESIRQQTGWFKGLDNKWRFEIDDSKMKYLGMKQSDKILVVEYENKQRRMETLENKFRDGTITDSEEQEYYDIDDYLINYSKSEIKNLSAYIEHPELFKAYPQLKNVKVQYKLMEQSGSYDESSNTISVNALMSEEDQKKTLIHEIQHAIQEIEGFAKGASVAYWNENKIDNTSSYDSYLKTAGEIEANDAANRIDLTAEQRKNIRPDIDRKDVVFSDYNNVKHSIDDTITEEEKSEFNSALDKLSKNEEITLDKVLELKIIRKAYTLRGEFKPTINDNSIERKKLREKVQHEVEKLGSAVAKGDKWEYNGDVKRERRIDIVIGLPAAGKSSVIVDPLSATYKSRIIDSDVVKGKLPEFNNGLGAENVHEESKLINEKILDDSVKLHENIVLPIVGSEYNSVINRIINLKNSGYKVYLHLNELPMYKALGRMLNRYIETGRFLEPWLIYDYQNKPTQVFEKILEENGGMLDGYSRYSNDVKRGEEPIFKYGTEDYRRIYVNRRYEENRQTDSRKSQEGRTLSSDRTLGITDTSEIKLAVDDTITEEENGGMLDGYSRYSNDVERGEEPIFKYGTEDYRRIYVNRRYEENRRTGSRNLQEGRALSSDRTLGITDTSEIKLAVDDTISDGMFADNDLFDENGYIQQSAFERAVNNNPDYTLVNIYNHAAKTAEMAIKQSKDISLNDKAYLDLARKLMIRYGISRKLNKNFDEDFARIIKNHTERIENGVTDFANELEKIIDDCKDALLRSGEFDSEALKTEREKIVGYLKGKTLLITDYAESNIRSNYENIQNFRRRMFGKVNVALERNDPKGSIIYIDDVIEFVDENFPQFITDECNDINGFQWLDNLINSVLKPKFVNSYIDGMHENIDTAAIEMAFDITTEIISSKAKQSVSDSKAERKRIRQLAAAKKQAESMQKALKDAKLKSYRDRYQDERNKRIEQIKRMRERLSEQSEKNDSAKLRYEAQIENLKTSLDKKTIILNMGYDNIRKEYFDARYKTQAIQSFYRLKERAQKRYTKPKTTAYIPSELYGKMFNVMDILCEDVPGSVLSVHKLVNAIKELKDSYLEYTENGDHSDAFQKQYYNQKAEELKRKTQSSVKIPDGIRKEIWNLLDDLEKFIKTERKTNLRDYCYEDVKSIYSIFKLLDGIMNDTNKVIIKGKEHNAYIVSREIVKEFENVKGTRLISNTVKDRAEHAINVGLETFQNNMNNPIQFAKRMVNWQEGSSFVETVKELDKGQTDSQNLQMDWVNQAEDVLKKYNQKELENYKYNTAIDINKTPITQDMAVEILLEWEDEYGRAHIEKSGYTQVPNLKYLKRKSRKKAYSNDVTFAMRVSRNDIAKIRKLVKSNSLCNDIYKLCKKLYNEDMQNAVNEVSKKKYGYDIATILNYCPITIDNNEVERQFADVLIIRSINSRTFLRSRIDGTNGLKLMGALDKLGNQIDAVSSWCGLTIPIEGFSKIYHITEYQDFMKRADGTFFRADENGKIIEVDKTKVKSLVKKFPSVKKVISKTWGDRADSYISKLMGDLQGASKIETSSIDVLTSNYIKAKLIANISSAIKQICSYPLAASVTGWKAVVRGIKHIRPGKHTPLLNKILPESYKHNPNMKKLEEYSPILWYRQQGNNNKDIHEINKFKSLGDPEKGLERIGDKLHLDLTLNWLERVDNIMVNMNYWICYEYVKKDLKINPDSDKFMPKLAETLEEIVNTMMPNNSIMQQGQILRSRNPLTKIFTICKSQVFCVGNALMDTYGERNARAMEYKAVKNDGDTAKVKIAREALNKANRKYARTVSASLASMAMMGFIAKPIISIILGILDRYKDDDDQITTESVFKRIGLDLANEFLGNFLGGEELYNIIVSSFDKDVAYYADSVPGIDALFDVTESFTDMWHSDNLFEDGLTLATSISTAFGIPLDNAKKIVQAIYNHIANSVFYSMTPAVDNYGEVTTARYTSTCYTALINGNIELYETYKNRWLQETTESGKPVDEDYINNKMKEELEDNADIIVAADALECGNLDKYESIVDKYTQLGFDENTVVKAVNSAIDNILDEINDNNIESDDIIAELEKHGVSEKVAQESYDDMIENESDNESDETESQGIRYTYSDAFEALKNGNKENYNRIKDYLINEGGKTEVSLKSAMRSTSRTDPMWKEYIEASKKNDKEKMFELKQQLINIYGSWSTAVDYMHKYQDRMKKEEK